MKKLILLMVPVVLVAWTCGSGGSKTLKSKNVAAMEKEYPVKLITVDPGHFHAALVQKRMYDQISPDVHVYAPDGPDIIQHLDRIKAYNKRAINPTSWNEMVFNGPDYFEKMIAGKTGNVVVLAGNNRKKAEYITRSVNAGLNVLSDKPMIINPEDFPVLRAAFATAKEKGVLLYDIMTERYEVTTIMQKLLSEDTAIFGTLVKGSEKEPAVTKISIHNFSKVVSGTPLLRPAWFFDVVQQGEGIVDVTTHLVDLIQWECFPEQILKPEDINMIRARRWPTLISREEYKGVTGLEEFPEYLQKDIKDGKLNVFSNGEMVYQIKGVYAKVSVEWKYHANESSSDTHFSVMHGTNCDLVIRQGAEQKFLPTLYVENIKGQNISELSKKLNQSFEKMPFDSLQIKSSGNNSFEVVIPSKYRVSHEEHFGQVTSKFLEYLKSGKIPEWEIQGMITKYFTTTSALKLARGK